MALQLLPGGRAPATVRILAPRAPLARRAGLSPVAVPADMWVAPGLLAALAPSRAHLRIVA